MKRGLEIIFTNVVWLLKRNKLKKGTIKTFQSNVDSPKYKMRMNFKKSGKIYTNKVKKKGKVMQGKLTEYWLQNRHVSVTESNSKNKSEQNVYENAAATSGSPKSL